MSCVNPTESLKADPNLYAVTGVPLQLESAELFLRRPGAGESTVGSGEEVLTGGEPRSLMFLVQNIIVN